jgi:uncharacterized DUF497 family protein
MSRKEKLDKKVFFVYKNNMEFEYDPNKSASNKIKHGIDFDEAQKLWLDPYALTAPVDKVEEPRFLVVAEYERKLWTAVITLRGSVMRIISVRRAREEEVRNYEKRKWIAQRNIR